MIVLVTDPRYGIDHTLRTIARVREVLDDDSLVVQFRDKVSPSEERARAATAIMATGARTVINGTPEEASRLGTFGVHLPGDTPDIAHAREVLGDAAWVSIAAHDDDAITRAAFGGATAALVSPIYEVPGKAAPRGIEALTRARALSASRVRIIALGGIDSRRAAACVQAGADGIAVIRAIFDAPDPGAAALELTAHLRSSPLRP